MSSEVGGIPMLTGHADAVEFFRHAIANDRLAHAYLFLGPAGVGKAAFAKELTKYLFCLDRREPPPDGTFGHCGTCRNCLRVDHGNLPDLHEFSRPADKRDIPIDLMRELQRQLSFKPVEGPYKVFIIHEADRLNPSSANCLLKVLEEPPAHSLILLLAEGQEDFLPTILSRAHVVRFKGLQSDDLAGLLSREFEMGPDRARFLSRMSGGSPGQARKLNDEGFSELHEWLLERVRGMKPDEHFDVALEVRKRLGEKVSSVQEERELLHVHLDGLMLSLRDELAEVYADQGACQRGRKLQDAIGAVLAASEAISVNCNIRLVLENLLFEVAGASTQPL